MERRKRGNRKYQERNSKPTVNIQNILNRKIEKKFNIEAKKFLRTHKQDKFSFLMKILHIRYRSTDVLFREKTRRLIKRNKQFARSNFIKRKWIEKQMERK